MFKKLKDKLAEEVKSSPQRIQQIAQAAQAAVTSASSSISDITNSDLFSIGDNDGQANKPSMSTSHPTPFQDVLLMPPASYSGSNSIDFLSAQDMMENQRQRRLSNSSLSSDVSFRLPSYESPSMYHLQSDMEVSASEAEERGFSSGAISLDRVTKEQLYAAYRRTQERYTKYRTQYADLARHYKLLERENAKARSVLVETQDKALRRISELREQCSLEQSAKAHLEKALREEIEERNLKIEALTTKVSLLHNNFPSTHDEDNIHQTISKVPEKENEVQLINLSTENDIKPSPDETRTNEAILNSKIEKMELLLNKYKDSLKTIKEKNSQMTTELQILSNELDDKKKENDQLKDNMNQLTEAQRKIQDLENINEELQNKINTYDFSKSKEISILEFDLHKSQEEIAQLQSKIDVFSKREEEYAISLAENKLSIHKELESKESEIKSLKNTLSFNTKELQSLNIVLSDYKNNITTLEEERQKLSNEVNEFNICKSRLLDAEKQIETLSSKCQSLEQVKMKSEEELKCLQLEMNQETAEKLAMVDRNTYLEKRISQLSEENTKKSMQISQLENDLLSLANIEQQSTQKLSEIEFWKAKYSSLENEIQEERDELIKLQTEIEKLLANDELVQNQNAELHNNLSTLKSENRVQRQQLDIIKNKSKLFNREMGFLRNDIKTISEVSKLFKKEIYDDLLPDIMSKLVTLNNHYNEHSIQIKYNKLEKDYSELQIELKKVCEDLNRNVEEIVIINQENKDLSDKIKTYESKILTLNEEIKDVTEKLANSTNDTQVLKTEKQKLLLKLQEVENLCNHLQNSVDHDKSQYLTALDKLKLLEDDKQTLQKRLNNIEKENESLNIEVEKLKVLHKDDISRNNLLSKEKQAITEKLEENQLTIQQFEQTVQMLSVENNTLKNQSESISNNLKALELEVDEVRKSHNEIVIEKDRLNSNIEELERKQLEATSTISVDKNMQTDSDLTHQNIEDELLKKNVNALEGIHFSDPKSNGDILALLENVEVLTAKNTEFMEEIKSLKDINETLSNKLKEFNNESNNNDNSDENVIGKYRTLSNDYELLKEDNRRLQSDIEGLQTYLTKISKENGVLNDKLRESIASSENFSGKNDFNTMDNGVLELQNEVLSGKEKIEDLIRENTLLLEENLELKDQLNSQHFTEHKKTSDKNENDYASQERYNNLLINKNKLEEKLMSLEQMNKSMNGNMQHIQNNNEKLKLTNEKLERRLDEALVSLRHLHSLQENTELEYLRNILYEYLTGSGTHSITLAKVLAAVVKFDDKQTQNILQKEKERQGLLRQLGLL